MPFSANLHEYHVVGRKLPTEKDLNPKLYKMRLFSPNQVVAKSKFWYFLQKVSKVKKMTGEIVACNEIIEENQDEVKNYGVFLRYDSRSGTHNVYKEFRDVTAANAVSQCYREMAARHRARAHSIQIIRVDVLEPNQCKRPNITQFHDPNIKFPLTHRILKTEKRFRSKFLAYRPRTYYG